MMVEIYYKLVKENRRKIEDVPEHLREQVKEKLAADENAN